MVLAILEILQPLILPFRTIEFALLVFLYKWVLIVLVTPILNTIFLWLHGRVFSIFVRSVQKKVGLPTYENVNGNDVVRR